MYYAVGRRVGNRVMWMAEPGWTEDEAGAALFTPQEVAAIVMVKGREVFVLSSMMVTWMIAWRTTRIMEQQRRP